MSDLVCIIFQEKWNVHHDRSNGRSSKKKNYPGKISHDFLYEIPLWSQKISETSPSYIYIYVWILFIWFFLTFTAEYKQWIFIIIYSILLLHYLFHLPLLQWEQFLLHKPSKHVPANPSKLTCLLIFFARLTRFF